jgi:hypothetical protein
MCVHLHFLLTYPLLTQTNRQTNKQMPETNTPISESDNVSVVQQPPRQLYQVTGEHYIVYGCSIGLNLGKVIGILIAKITK